MKDNKENKFAFKMQNPKQIETFEMKTKIFLCKQITGLI